MNRFLTRFQQFSNGTSRASLLGCLRIGTGVTIIMKLCGADALLYKLLRGYDIVIQFPKHTFAPGGYRLEGLRIPYLGLERLPVPSFELYGQIEVVLLILAILWTLGVLTRYSGALLLAVSAYLFALSQLSYHHHVWLMLLTLAILVLAPSGRRLSVDNLIINYPATPISILPYRMIQILLSSIYLFAGLSKLNSDWLSGLALDIFVSDNSRLTPVIENTFLTYQLLSLGIIASMLFLSVGFWHPRTRRIALLVGISLHLGIDSVLDVGTYSYQMLVLYLAFFAKPN